MHVFALGVHNSDVRCKSTVAFGLPSEGAWECQYPTRTGHLGTLASLRWHLGYPAKGSWQVFALFAGHLGTLAYVPRLFSLLRESMNMRVTETICV